MGISTLLARSIPPARPRATIPPASRTAATWNSTGCQTDVLYCSQYTAVSPPGPPATLAKKYFSVHPVTTA